MEPVTTALLGALAAGAAAGVKDSAKKLIVDGYQAVKELLKKKFGEDSKVVEAVVKLEDDPESPGWRESLGKEIAKVKAELGAEIEEAAAALLQEIKALPAGEQHIQKIVGNYNAIADRNSTATVNITTKE